jgi:hypothetical protein
MNKESHIKRTTERFFFLLFVVIVVFLFRLFFGGEHVSDTLAKNYPPPDRNNELDDFSSNLSYPPPNTIPTASTANTAQSHFQ